MSEYSEYLEGGEGGKDKRKGQVGNLAKESFLFMG